MDKVISRGGGDSAGALGGDLAVVAGERGLPPNEMGAAGMHPDSALIATHHLLTVVESDAAGAVHRPLTIAPVLEGSGGRRAVGAPLH